MSNKKAASNKSKSAQPAAKCGLSVHHYAIMVAFIALVVAFIVIPGSSTQATSRYDNVTKLTASRW